MKIILKNVTEIFIGKRAISLMVGASLIIITLILVLSMNYCGGSSTTTTATTTATEELTTSVTTIVTTEVDTTAGATSVTTTIDETNPTTISTDSTTTANEITISFDSQGGSSCSNITVESGQSTTLPTPYLDGNDFLGWFTEPNGQGDQVDFTTALNVDSTLYAYWQDSSIYKISFEVNGGQEINDIEVDRDNPNNISINYAVKPGYLFDGWYLNPELTGTVYYSTISIDSNVTLYAAYSLPTDVFTYEYMTHRISGVEGYFITEYSSGFYDNVLVLPSEIDGHEIVGVADTFGFSYAEDDVYKLVMEEGYLVIDSNAFSNLFQVEEIQLPSTLTHIGDFSISNLSSLVSLNLDDCVNLEYLGDGALSYNSGLTSIILPDSVEYMGWGTFTGDTSLVSFTFPETMINPTLPNGMFSECTSLTTVNLPDNLLIIGDGMFQSTAISSITIPASVYMISDWAFMNSSLYTINFEDESNIKYIGGDVFTNTPLIHANPNDMLVINDMLVGYSGDGSNIVIPEGVKKICGSVFISLTITNISFNNDLEEIDNFAFSSVTFLNTVTLPDSIKRMGDGAFECTHFNNQAWIMPLNLEHLGAGAFMMADGLTDIIFQPASSLTSIGSDAFTSSSITSVSLNANLEEIGNSAFSYTDNLTGTVVIPASVSTLGYSAFYNSEVTNVQFEDIDNITEFGSRAFDLTPWANSFTDFIIVDGVLLKYIGHDSVVTIPAEVTVINSYAFEYTGVQSVDLNNVVKVGDLAFLGTSLETIHLPETLKHIGINAFWTSSLTSVTWDAGFNPDYVHGGAFGFPESASFFQSVDAQNLVIFGDYLYSGRFATGNVAVPSNITGMSPGVFQESAVVSVSLPSGITEIPDYAFISSSLSSFTIPESITSIGEYAFANTNISQIIIPSTVEVIKQYAFANTSQLTSVVFLDPSSLVRLEGRIFSQSAIIEISTREDDFAVIDGILFEYVGHDHTITIPEDVNYYAMSVENGSPILQLIIPEHVNVFPVFPNQHCGWSQQVPVLVFEGQFATNTFYLEFFNDFYIETLIIPSGYDFEIVDPYIGMASIRIYTQGISIDETDEHILKYLKYIHAIIEES